MELLGEGEEDLPPLDPHRQATIPAMVLPATNPKSIVMCTFMLLRMSLLMLRTRSFGFLGEGINM